MPMTPLDFTTPVVSLNVPTLASLTILTSALSSKVPLLKVINVPRPSAVGVPA